MTSILSSMYLCYQKKIQNKELTWVLSSLTLACVSRFGLLSAFSVGKIIP